jgi:hypothetical protein
MPESYHEATPIELVNLNPKNSLLVRLLAVDATGPLHDLCRIVDGVKCAPCGVHTLDHQPPGDDDPEGVHEDEVSPVVGGLGA